MYLDGFLLKKIYVHTADLGPFVDILHEVVRVIHRCMFTRFVMTVYGGFRKDTLLWTALQRYDAHKRLI